MKTSLFLNCLMMHGLSSSRRRVFLSFFLVFREFFVLPQAGAFSLDEPYSADFAATSPPQREPNWTGRMSCSLVKSLCVSDLALWHCCLTPRGPMAPFGSVSAPPSSSRLVHASDSPPFRFSEDPTLSFRRMQRGPYPIFFSPLKIRFTLFSHRADEPPPS